MITNFNLEKNILNLRFQKINKVSQILSRILVQISREKDFVIISNYMNKMSLDLIYEGAAPKPYYINYRTEKEGILGGYILHEESYKLPSRLIQLQINLQKICFFRDYSNSIRAEAAHNTKKDNDYIKALINEGGKFFTSDLDILMICGKGNLSFQEMDQTYGMGNILKYEYDLIQLINKTFTRTLKYRDQHHLIPLISHGPFNRYPKSKLEDINFPLVIYHPHIGRFILGSETDREKSISDLLMLLDTLKFQGYYIDIHKNWIT